MGDIQSSTANWLAAPEAMDRALRVHDAIVADAVAAADGVVFKHTGDGFLAQFEDAGAAVAAVVRIRTLLADVDADLVPLLQVRLAIDTGWASNRNGDWFGPVVNRVARLTDLSSTTGALASRVAVESARQPLDAVPLGSVVLRSHREPLAVFGIGGASLEGAAAQTAPSFPSSLTTFIGRVDEVGRVAELIGEARLVTVVATGGAGKTRLAIEVGEAAATAAGFADLVPCADGADVARHLAFGVGTDAAALSNTADPDALLDHVISVVGSSEYLLVVDNCEHVRDDIAAQLRRLLEACPALRVLATSREALELVEERVYLLPMFDVGVELFFDRAAGHGIELEPTPDVVDVVTEICTRLDGLPLAIEVAAALLRDRSLREVIANLDRIELARGAPSVAGERHRTMRDVVGWSHASLPLGAQQLFDRLSLFEGSFRAEDLGLLPDADREDLRLLVRRSLVLQERDALDLRYRMLEPVRQVARSFLAERGAEDAARLALADGFLARFEEEYGHSWWSWSHVEAVRPLLPTAWALVDWLIERGDDLGAVRLLSRVAGAAIVFAGAPRVVDVLSARTDLIQSLPDDEQARLLVLYSLSGIGSMQIDHSVAGVVALFAMELPPSPPRVYATRSAALGAMNNLYRAGDDLQFALDLLADAREVAAVAGSRYERAAVEAYFGWAHLLGSRWDDVDAVSRAGLRHVEPTNVWHVVLSANLAMSLLRRERFDEALAVARDHPDHGRYYYMGDLLGLVEILALAGRGDLAAADAAFADAVDQVLGSNHPGHRSDLALVGAWLLVHHGRPADGARLVSGPLATRGPHTLQLITGLDEAVGVEIDRSFQTEPGPAEAHLPALLVQARDAARARVVTATPASGS